MSYTFKDAIYLSRKMNLKHSEKAADFELHPFFDEI